MAWNDHHLPLFERLRAAGHTLKLDKDGDVDSFALNYDFHNGPACVTCYRSWCQHCTTDKDAIVPCEYPPIDADFSVAVAGALSHD